MCVLFKWSWSGFQNPPQLVSFIYIKKTNGLVPYAQQSPDVFKKCSLYWYQYSNYSPSQRVVLLSCHRLNHPFGQEAVFHVRGGCSNSLLSITQANVGRFCFNT